MITAMEWKPCPFCGESRISYQNSRKFYEERMADTGKAGMWAFCENTMCGAWVDAVYRDKTYDEALADINERWNRRTK